METEFIYWRHDTSVGVRVEELSGGEDKSPKIWKVMALQVFGEQGGDRYREIGHYTSGAPYLEDSQQRISVSHTPRFMVVASLPRTPEADLSQFSQRTAMGIDVEKPDREQALRVADRVMTPAELQLCEEYASALPLDAEEARVRATVLAWTVKEALYKAALQEGLDFRECLVIRRLPEICDSPLAASPRYGEAEIRRDDMPPIPMRLFTYLSEDHLVTIALAAKCATFKKH